mgnify:CR=1 FL=1|tara:strand:+ start:36 stop:470 length:435 start_codon:yes stop_codon:yes gene_type:complete
MANINIKFNGKEFLLSCEDGQEEHLDELSKNLNEKFNQLKTKLGNLGESKLLLITSITLMDEYFETKKKIEEKKDEIEKIKKKFIELKSLVYGYKEQKDNEINSLQKEQEQFKKELENLNNGYEKIIDDASSQIEEFINKNNFS